MIGFGPVLLHGQDKDFHDGIHWLDLFDYSYDDGGLIDLLGYIGGSILERLLVHPNAQSFEITALVRSKDKADKLKKLGVTPVVGSYSDTSLLEDLAAGADVVFDAVSWSKSSQRATVPMSASKGGRGQLGSCQGDTTGPQETSPSYRRPFYLHSHCACVMRFRSSST